MTVGCFSEGLRKPRVQVCGLRRGLSDVVQQLCAHKRIPQGGMEAPPAGPRQSHEDSANTPILLLVSVLCFCIQYGSAVPSGMLSAPGRLSQ